MTDTISPETQALRDEQAARFTAAYIATNRLQYNDAGESDDPTQVGQWYCEIDRVIAGENKGCACGCGLEVTNSKRNFLPGHDQRLMGILVRAHRENLDVMWTDGGMLVGGSGPMDYAELVLNEGGQVKLAGYLANTPKRARKSAKPAADAAPVVVADPLPKTVKLGRWEYPVTGIERDGNGTIVRVTYKNKRDEEITVSSWGKLA